ncbi:hypothetical protein SAY86_010519 [Trapa natans]|uniref:Bifunctional inhibitor/plant lipid transfer protein/seed storage helical domain-containing protein n=1 Tax=Trapa natans TaxID=22666 RepID=A0AAN7LI67_TRANT|nr:hypothetical protein SAY86_010519 [Trapa natans]
MARPGVRILLVVAILATCWGQWLPAAVAFNRCQYVYEYFSYCIDFLVGCQLVVPRQCCSHVRKLNFLAKHMLGPRLICNCIEAMVKGMEPPLIAYNIYALTLECSIHLSFPISSSMDCSKAHSLLKPTEGPTMAQFSSRLIQYLCLLLIVVLLLMGFSSSSTATESPSIICSDVFGYFRKCIGFLTGIKPCPGYACCISISELNEKTQQLQDGPKTVCQCIEDVSYVTKSIYNFSRIHQLNTICQKHLSFPISIAMNCSK